VLRDPSLRAPARYPVSGLVYRRTADSFSFRIWGKKDKGNRSGSGRGSRFFREWTLYPGDPQRLVISSIRRYRRFCWRYPVFRKIPLYICLSAFNAVAWWMTAQFSNAMKRVGANLLAPGRLRAGLRDRYVVFDMFDSGNRTSFCWAMMLFGFGCRSTGARGWGSMFAMATAIKVSRLAVCFPYMLGRGSGPQSQACLLSRESSAYWLRHPSRGYHATCFRTEEPGFREWSDRVRNRARAAWRGGTWSWVNQSIIASDASADPPVNYN